MNDSFYFQIKLSSQFTVYFNLNTHTHTHAGLILMCNKIIPFIQHFEPVCIGAPSEDVLDVKKRILRIQVEEKAMQK